MDDASSTVVSRGPCPDCHASDNLVTYADGHRFCFTPGCGLKAHGNKDGKMSDETTAKVKEAKAAIPFTSEHMPQGLTVRKVNLETLTKFGYFMHKDKGEVVHVCNLYTQSGQHAYQKFRNKEKDFWFVLMMDNPPKPHECMLVGQQVWGEKNDRKVVVIEGEIDMLTAAQATQFKTPIVSVPAGVGSAIKAVKANYRWLDRFEEVIFWMDGDEPGQSVIPELCSMFPEKAKTIKVEGFKDASDMAQAGKIGDIYGAVWGATTYSPEGILLMSNLVDDMNEPEGEVIMSYPWPIIQEKTMGIREGEVIYHVAGTGVGKTSQAVELQVQCLLENVPFAVLRFEDTRRKAQLDLMSVEAGKRLHIDPLPVPEMRALHTKVFGGKQAYVFDPETAAWDWESIKSYLRYLVRALGVKVIFIDPLSFLISGMNERDERKALDLVAYENAKFVKHYKANLQIMHHLTRPVGSKGHEEGAQVSVNQIRGSGGIANYSMGIIGYERNQQGERPDLTRARLLKNRFTGWTGVADILKWDEATGRNLPTDEAYPDSNGSGSDPGFDEVKDYA